MGGGFSFRIVQTVVVAALSCCLVACAAPNLHPVVATRTLPSPVVSETQEVLDPRLLQDDATVGAQQGYRVGPGDTLMIGVFNHPEMAIANYAGSNAGSANLPAGRAIGYSVDNDGSIELPLVGKVAVKGKTTDELRVLLEDSLSRFIRDPKVVVQIIFTGSIRYYLLGQFTAPGLKFADRPMRLLEALSLGGTIDLAHASLSGAYVARKGKLLPVNFRLLLRKGDMRYNIWLHPEDTIMVPDNSNEQAFVFAAAATGTSKGGPVPFLQGKLDILQALAQSGVGFRDEAQGLLSEVRVIRSEGDRGQYFVVDVEKILRGEAASFMLAPGDIVFIPASGLTGWNEALNQMLPTLQTISGLLTPFVQVKYLSQ
jgi:polysaccharide biosynthesis/export protein